MKKNTLKLIGCIFLFFLFTNQKFTAKASNEGKFENKPSANLYDVTMKQDLLTLMLAYPEPVSHIQCEDNGSVYLVMKSGKKILYDDKKEKSFEGKLANPDIQDMMEQGYPLETITKLMDENFDPGRLRVYSLLNEVYGWSKEQIESNLKNANIGYRYYQFNGNNKASEELEAVMKEIVSLSEKRKDIYSCIFPANGTYNYRYISGTNRLSPHSFGIAIDLKRDNRDYWRWTSREEGEKRLASYPKEVVEIFEKHNFIWGGKWSHFDILHFEYRPEIILKARYFGNKYEDGKPWYSGAPVDEEAVKGYIEKINEAFESREDITTNSKFNDNVANYINQIFKNRNKAILNRDLELIETFYDTKTKYGVWAYEHEKKKVQYIHNWEQKQGVKFTDISSNVMIKKIRGDEEKYTVSLLCCTEYKYVYENQQEVNRARIGTTHFMNIIKIDDKWVITKEWYKDPFADSLNLENLKANSIKEFITTQSSRDFSDIGERRQNAIEYAQRYCGAASKEKYGFKYNKNYRNYNTKGGDCANFASQILFEGGKFSKNRGWNYDRKGATGAWVNAGKFKDYMIYNGRASLIAYGDYEKVYKASYKLLPGDFIAYEKKGDVTHISVVTGADSKGYSLVTCHNTDRDSVPWDLGWNDKKIKFWLVRVHY